MNNDIKEKLDYRYERIGEISYWIMLVFTIVLIVVATVGTAIVRKGLGTEITLVPKEILEFIEKILWIFVLPVSIKIGGETFTKTLLAWRGISNFETNVNELDSLENEVHSKKKNKKI